MSDENTLIQQVTAPSFFAGFWRRFLAFLIDYNVVIFGLLPFFLVSGFLAPNAVEVTTPYGLFSTERTLEETPADAGLDNGGGSNTVRFFERTYLGKWTYIYKETTERKDDTAYKSITLVDPKTRKAMDLIDADDFVWWVLLVYWSLMEASKHQASLGKQALRVLVVDQQGRRIGIPQAFGRNVAKLLSAITLFIGFMMAGWTQRKQGLHDMVSGCLVIKRSNESDSQG